MLQTILNLVQTYPYIAAVAGFIGIMLLRKLMFLLVIVCVLGYFGMNYGN